MSKPVLSTILAVAALAALPGCRSTMFGDEASVASATSGPFAGVKADRGHVVHRKRGTRNVLALSDDFVVPDTPDPHWQVVDSAGNRFLLQRLPVKDQRVNREIILPGHVRDVKSVQIWCAFAEVLLGEAVFDHAVQ